jgi:hypothetical protein
MHAISITVNDAPLTAIVENTATAARRMAVAFKRDLAPVGERMRAVLIDEPPVWKGKRRWKSDAQRKAVMAKLRKAGNLPYQRTHRLVKSWRIVLTADETGGVFGATNATPYARYVQGLDQQPMHLDSGWARIDTTAEAYRQPALDATAGAWHRVTNPFAKAG